MKTPAGLCIGPRHPARSLSRVPEPWEAVIPAQDFSLEATQGLPL